MNNHDPLKSIREVTPVAGGTTMPINKTMPLSTVSRAGKFQRQLSTAIEKIGEWFNPLLVKEVRQSLKSRQFSLTFALVLCLAWGWSIAGVTHLGAGVSFGATGPEMFYGYYLI